jgi:predicted RNase H-like HicB family nuclease
MNLVIIPTRQGVAVGRKPVVQYKAYRGPGAKQMRTCNVVVERDPDTGLFVGSVPGWPGAHSQGDSLEELKKNLREVITMLMDDVKQA